MGSLPRSEREHNFLPKLSVKVTSVVFEREIWNFDADLTHVFMDSCTHIYIYIYKSPEGGLEGRRKGGREREAVGEGGKGCPLPLSLPLRSSLPRVPSLGTACKPTGPGSDLFPATYPQHFSPSMFMCQRSPLQPFVHPFPPLPPPPLLSFFPSTAPLFLLGPRSSILPLFPAMPTSPGQPRRQILLRCRGGTRNARSEVLREHAAISRRAPGTGRGRCPAAGRRKVGACGRGRGRRGTQGRRRLEGECGSPFGAYVRS